MEISFFLAKVLGLYMLIVGVGMVFDASRFRPLALEMLGQPPLLFLSDIISLIVGILLVVSHNIWVMDWRVAITVIAWVSFILGAFRVIFPQFIVETSRKWAQSDAFYYLSGVATLVLGVIFCYHGFFPA